MKCNTKSFIINTEELEKSLTKVETILKSYNKYVEQQQLAVKNYDLKKEAKVMKNFLKTLDDLVKNTIKIKKNVYSPDIFGNTYDPPYQFIEVTPGDNNVFSVIRFYGQEGSTKKRFYLSDIKHNFSPISINLLQNLKELVNPIFDIKSILGLVTEGFSFSWDEFVTKYFDPPPEIVPVGTLTDANLELLRQDFKYDFLTAKELNFRNSKIFAQKINLFKKSINDFDVSVDAGQLILDNIASLKGLPDYRKVLNEVGKFIDRYSFSSILQDVLLNALPPNFNFEDSLRALKPNQFLNRLSIIFPKDSDLYVQIENIIESSFLGEFANIKEKYQNLLDLQVSFEQLNFKLDFEKIIPIPDFGDLGFLENSLRQYLEQFGKLQKECAIKRSEMINSLGFSTEQKELISKKGYSSIVECPETDQEKKISKTINNALESEYSSVNECALKIEELKVSIGQINDTINLEKGIKLNLENFKILENLLDSYSLDIKLAEIELKNLQLEIFEFLGLSERQIKLFSLEKFNLLDIVSDPKTPEEEEILEKIKERILLELNNFVPLAELGPALLKTLSFNFDLSEFKMPPTRPVNDPFGSFSKQILDIFLQVTTEFILVFVESFINDLISSSNFDSLIADLMSSYDNNLNNILNQATSFDANNIVGQIANEATKLGGLEELVDVFGANARNTIAGLADNIAKNICEGIQKTGQVNTANNANQQNFENVSLEMDSAKQTMFDYSSVSEFEDVFSSWEIDEKGENFIIRDGKRNIHVCELDNSLTNSFEEALRFLPADSIDNNLMETLISKIPEANKENTAQQKPTTNRLSSLPCSIEDLRGELADAIFRFTAIATPTEVVKTMAGVPPPSAVDLLDIIIDSSAPNVRKVFPTKDSISGLIIKVAEETNLGGALDKLDILVELPPNRRRPVPSKLCSPFDNVENFRKALMTKVVEPKVAEEILNNINNEKIKKYNELIDIVLAMTGGAIPNEITADPKRRLLDDVKRNILDPALENLQSAEQSGDTQDRDSDESAEFDETESERAEEEVDTSAPRTVSDLLRDEMKNTTDSSPMYLSMLETTLLSVFLPIRESFDRAIKGMLEPLTEVKTVDKDLPRIIKIKTEVDGEEKKVEVINPKFKDLLNQGLVPVMEKSSDKYAVMMPKKEVKLSEGLGIKIIGLRFFAGDLDDFRVSGDEGKDYTTPNWMLRRFQKHPHTLGFENPDRVKTKIRVQEKKRTLGDSNIEGLKQGFKKGKIFVSLDDSLFRISVAKFESKNSNLGDLKKKLDLVGKETKQLNIEGVGEPGSFEEYLAKNNGTKNIPGAKKVQQKVSVPLTQELSSISTMKGVLANETPSWDMSYEERVFKGKEETTLKLNTKGKSVTPKYGLKDFASPTNKKYDRFFVNEKTRQVIADNLNTQKTPLKGRVTVFRDFLSKCLYPSIDSTELSSFKVAFSSDLKTRQRKFIEKIAEDISNNIANTRLFKDTTIGNPDSEEKAKFLQLFNFIRKPTEYEKQLNIDPHIMDFDSLYQKFKEVYDAEPEVPLVPEMSDGTVKKPTRFTNATYKIMLDVIVRIGVVDFCLKTLPVLDTFLYTKHFSDIEILTDFVTDRIKQDLEETKMYDIFIRQKEIDEGLKNAKDKEKYLRDLAKEEKDTPPPAKTNNKKSVPKENKARNASLAKTETKVKAKNKRRREFKGKTLKKQIERQVEQKVRENLELILNKMADIFYVSKADRRVDQFKKVFINNLSLFDIHAEDERLVFFKLPEPVIETVTREKTIAEVLAGIPASQKQQINRAINWLSQTTRVAEKNPDNSFKRFVYVPNTNYINYFITRDEKWRTGDASITYDQQRNEFDSLDENLKISIYDMRKAYQNEENPEKKKLFEFNELNKSIVIAEITKPYVVGKPLFVEETKKTEGPAQENIKKNDFLLQKYVRFGQLNVQFRNDPILKKLENKTLNIDYVRELLLQKNGNLSLYNCDNKNAGAFREPPKFGLRLCVVYDSGNNIGKNKFKIGSKQYTISNNSDNLLYGKEFVKGKVNKSYNLLGISSADVDVDANLNIKQLAEMMNGKTYREIFYPSLRTKLLSGEELQVILDYCLPVKEIAAMATLHTYYINNNENSKYLLDSVKETIQQTLGILDNFGVKTRSSQQLLQLKEKQALEIANEGNPAGPLNFDLLKVWLRTPIHILRGLASIVDLNIFIADKIVAGVSIAGSLLGQKIFLPYSLASIALLPFPIFTPPPAGIIPPLTTYTLPLPLGPIFLILEPLLWDLPWFQDMNSDTNNPDVVQNLANFGIDINNSPDKLAGLGGAAPEELAEVQEVDDILDPNISESVIDAILEKVKKECGLA